ncbi:MAG: PspC domain-containing protein [Candidatus Heimdallarchaeota archaeon]
MNRNTKLKHLEESTNEEPIFPFEVENKQSQNTEILIRSRNDYLLSGVLGGLARYWKINSTLVRVVFLISVVITSGITLLIYLLLIKIIPLEEDRNSSILKT